MEGDGCRLSPRDSDIVYPLGHAAVCQGQTWHLTTARHIKKYWINVFQPNEIQIKEPLTGLSLSNDLESLRGPGAALAHPVEKLSTIVER